MKNPFFLCLVLLFAVHGSSALDIKITEVLLRNTQFPDSDGDYFPWVEICNFSFDTLVTGDYYVTDNINAPRTWRIPSVSISPGHYIIVWFSGKNRIEATGEIHLASTLAATSTIIGIYNAPRGHYADVFSVDFLPPYNQSVGRFPELDDDWILYRPELVSKGSENPNPGKWQQLAAKTNFPPRDNNPNASLVYKNQFWLLAGETRDEQGVWTPVTDVWKSSDGIKWEMVTPAGPYRHISSFVVFNDKMWAFDDHAYSSSDGKQWMKKADNVPFKPFYSRVIQFRDHLVNVTERSVYKSVDGENWIQIADNAPWASRELFHVIDFKDKLWLLGGVSNYYTDSSTHYNDIWSSEDGSEWTLETDNAPWQGRLWPTVMVFNDKLWLMGGWNYYNDDGYFSYYGNFNDVWFYSYGGEWEKLETDRVWANRHAMYSMVHQDHLFLFAGYGGGGVAHLYNDVWKLDIREEPPWRIDTKTVVYGDQPFELTQGGMSARYYTDGNEVISANNDEKITIKAAGTGKVLIIQEGNENYYPRDTTVEVQVLKKELKLRVGNYEQKFRGSIPEFKIEYDGFMLQDDENSLDSKPRVLTTANIMSPVGEYPIKIESTTDKNYEIVTEDGTLTISFQSIVGVYPVPSTGVINFSTAFKLSPNAKLEILNTGGLPVKTFILSQDTDLLTVDFTDLPKGIYSFTLYDIGFVDMGRFIIH